MAFEKKTWRNRIAEYINRRLLTKEDGSTELVTVARDEGTISQEGDAFNAANMNDLEDRIDAEFNNINQSLNNLIIRKTYEVPETTTVKSKKMTTLIDLPNIATYVPVFAYATNGNISAAITLHISKINNIFKVIGYNTYDEDININLSTQITVMYERSTQK